MLNETLNLHLLEVNMSPNLNVDRKRVKLKRLYAQVVFDLFNLVGVGSYLHRRSLETRHYFQLRNLHNLFTIFSPEKKKKNL